MEVKVEVNIRTIYKNDYSTIHAFQCEYLDSETRVEFEKRVAAHPELYIAAFYNEDLAGICYGEPSSRSSTTINLQGIAVSLDDQKSYARKGIGSSLIRSFEAVVKQKGYMHIGVGCADVAGVELFYMKNGFIPCELVAKGPNHEEYERVQITDYESGKMTQEALRRKHRAHEVIFIFEKSIGSTNIT